jgi:hypothetical protein
MGKGSGFVYLVAGGQNVGKSKIVIEMTKASNRHTYVYDHRREYLERFGKSNCTIFYDREQFFSKIPKMYNGNIIIEEGTTFLKFQKDDAMSDVLSGAFHNGNIIYILFHFVEAIPKYILSMSHVLILFRTGDDEALVQRTRPKLAKHLHKDKTPKFVKLQEFN